MKILTMLNPTSITSIIITLLIISLGATFIAKKLKIGVHFHNVFLSLATAPVIFIGIIVFIYSGRPGIGESPLLSLGALLVAIFVCFFVYYRVLKLFVESITIDQAFKIVLIPSVILLLLWFIVVIPILMYRGHFFRTD